MNWPGFVGTSYKSQSVLLDCEQCINWYVEKAEVESAMAPAGLYPTPGFQPAYPAAPGSPTRGLFGQAGLAASVIGSKVQQLHDDGTLTDRGTVLVDERLATMVTNGDGGGQLFVCSGRKGYILDLTSFVFTEVLADADQGGMIDDYFLALDVQTSTLKCSPLLDGLTWDPTQFAQRSNQPDPWRALLVGQNEFYLFGAETTDAWYNAGNFPFPFAPRPYGTMHQGIAAPASAALVNGKPTWLGANADGFGQVFQAIGYQAKPISTHALDVAVRGYTTISDAEAFTYQMDGHLFYVLTFPTANATWVYDESQARWHQCGTWNSGQQRYDAWHPRSHCVAFGKHLVGDRTSGVVARMGLDIGTEIDGSAIRRLRIPPGLQAQGERLSFGSFQLFLESGLGRVSGQGSAPTVSLRTSHDGSKTWGNARNRSAGPVGQYQRRVLWNRMGSCTNIFVPEITVTDPIPWRLVSASIEVDREAA